MTNNPQPTTWRPTEPTREQMEEDMAIDTDFDTGLNHTMSDHGTDGGHYSV